MKKLKDYKNNKGFTLVELIVVIVILAILAAILIPGLLKWIDEAKEAQYKLEAKAICQAAQAETVKLYAEGEKFEPDDPEDDIFVVFSRLGGALSSNEEELEKIEELSGIKPITVVQIALEKDTEGKASGEIKSAVIWFTSSDGNKIEASWNWIGGIGDKEWYIEVVDSF